MLAGRSCFRPALQRRAEAGDLLLILESAVPPRYMVHLRKVRPSSDEPIGAGGMIVRTRLQPIVPEEEPPAGE